MHILDPCLHYTSMLQPTLIQQFVSQLIEYIKTSQFTKAQGVVLKLLPLTIV